MIKNGAKFEYLTQHLTWWILIQYSFLTFNRVSSEASSIFKLWKELSPRLEISVLVSMELKSSLVLPTHLPLESVSFQTLQLTTLE